MTEPDCPFCDVKQFEKQLIAEVNGFYIIATLGQVTDGGYILLIPKDHISCLGMLPDNQLPGLFNNIFKASTAISREYFDIPVMMFEHGIVGQTVKHAHLHLLPTTIGITNKICSDFPTAKTEEIKSTTLQALYRTRQEPYLLWKDPNGRAMVCWNPPAPAQYLRTITAEALGRPERANWWTMDPELDKRLGSDTVRRLKPYFQS